MVAIVRSCRRSLHELLLAGCWSINMVGMQALLFTKTVLKEINVEIMKGWARCL